MKKLTAEEFINKSNKKHNHKYTYSKLNYQNNKIKVTIICPIHGEFQQRPSDHINGQGCPECKKKTIGDLWRNDINIIIDKCKNVHNNKYDYSLIKKYNNTDTKVKIICPKHGLFEQTPNGHLSGRGCQKCNMSKGETNIKKILEENNVKYIHQKIFKNCKNISYLPFDFYLPIHNLCVEYDGIQHFEPIRGELSLLNIIKNDKIKDEFCKNNNIKLLRIKFDENIENKLKNNI